MTIVKEAYTTYLDVQMSAMLNSFANKNRLSITEALESIVRIFFTDDDVLDGMVFNQHLEQEIEALKREVEHLSCSNAEAINSIEKLQEQVAELQERIDCV